MYGNPHFVNKNKDIIKGNYLKDNYIKFNEKPENISPSAPPIPIADYNDSEFNANIKKLYPSINEN